MIRKSWFICFLLMFFLSGCFDLESDIGGTNTQEEKPGNNDEGNSIYDLSLSNDGRFLVRGSWGLWDGVLQAVRVLDLTTGATAKITWGKGKNFHRMIFGRTGMIYFLVSIEGEEYIEEYALSTGNLVHSWPISLSIDWADHPKMAIDAANRRIVVWNDGDEISLLDTVTGGGYYISREYDIEDVKWLPDSNELVLVEAVGFMEAKISFLSSTLSLTKSISVPNCASKMEISPDGRTGMLSPTFCNKDPVSIIDLKERKFMENLPGFGPVAFAPDGSYAVAFARKDDLKEVAGIETETAYSILFIRLEDHSYKVVELGEELPIYTITPNGELVLLYVNNAYEVFEGYRNHEGIVVIDVDRQRVRSAEGPAVHLDEFVMTPDSENVFLIYGSGFYRLDTQRLVVERLALDCGDHFDDPSDCRADEIMITPDGSRLILGFITEIDFAFYDPTNYRITQMFTMEE